MASSRRAVPRLLTSTNLAMSGMYPPYAARWKTVSASSTARLKTTGSRTSPSTKSAELFTHRGVPRPCVCGSMLSRMRTLHPSTNSRSTRCDPIRPAPPVTNASRLGNSGPRIEDVGQFGGRVAEVATPVDLPLQQAEVLFCVDVELRLQQVDGHAHCPSSLERRRQGRGSAHRSAREDVVEAVHANQVVAAVVRRTKHDIVGRESGERLFDSIGLQLWRVGGREDNRPFCAGLAVAEKICLARRPV